MSGVDPEFKTESEQCNAQVNVVIASYSSVIQFLTAPK